MSDETILFVCPHGAAKSVLAAAAFARLAAARGLLLRVICAGPDPDPALAPAVVALLAREGLALPVAAPQLVTHAMLADAQRVISLGCTRTELPHLPAQWEQWDDVPPPSQGVELAWAVIQRHVGQLVATLQQ